MIRRIIQYLRNTSHSKREVLFFYPFALIVFFHKTIYKRHIKYDVQLFYYPNQQEYYDILIFTSLVVISFLILTGYPPLTYISSQFNQGNFKKAWVILLVLLALFIESAYVNFDQNEFDSLFITKILNHFIGKL